MKLNKKEYPDNGIFVEKKIQEYCNLKIYPYLGILERDAGLLTDLAEMFNEQQVFANYVIHGDPVLEDYQVLQDNLLTFEKKQMVVDLIYIFSGIDVLYNDIKNAQIVISTENDMINLEHKVKYYDKFIYMTKPIYNLFNTYFWYYFKNGEFLYDNLICYTMIIKNGGPLLEQVLKDNLDIIDRWCILDTGSTDGTQDVIRRVLANKKGKLYEEPFVNFKISRNRCLELAGLSCKFILMLDDTYAMRGDLRKFLSTVRGDQYSDSFSLLIQSNDNEYFSNRIIKSRTGLRYKYTIHEVIDDNNNVNVTVPKCDAFIFDNRADYMEERTTNRKKFDLELLFQEYKDNPNDPRALYYIAQTYGCIGDTVNQAKYFELRIAHPVQGYYQEKIDTYFELARTYNFKIHKDTGLPINGDLTEEEWENCEKLYRSAYELDKNRPDGIYFIGIHYYLKGDYVSAYKYFKLGFEIGYPINSQYSLKPTLSFHFLPKFLTEVCYYVEDYQLGLAAAKFFLENNKITDDYINMVNNWYKIHENLCKLKLSPVPTVHEEELFVIVADGGWSNWTGSDITRNGVGGSETWVIEIARNMKKLKNDKITVIVFCRTDCIELFEGVQFRPITTFHHFVSNNVVDNCVISRYPEYIPTALKGYCKTVSIIFHDLLSPELIIPRHPKMKYIFGLTDWHCKYINSIFPNFNIQKINYGIDSSCFQECPKIKNRFIYSSFPNRGLVILLRTWPRIRKILPDATLSIYCNLDQEWVNRVAPDDIKEIKTLLSLNPSGVTNYGWVSKKKLFEAWNVAEYWFYPCKFQETFCLTAFEAAASKTFVISNNLAALSETVGDRGLVVDGDPNSEEWQESILKGLKSIHDSPFKNHFIEKNYNYVKDRSWLNQAKLFSAFF
jgi:hypothetical protein